jgi:hypothetical protein
MLHFLRLVKKVRKNVLMQQLVRTNLVYEINFFYELISYPPFKMALYDDASLLAVNDDPLPLHEAFANLRVSDEAVFSFSTQVALESAHDPSVIPASDKDVPPQSDDTDEVVVISDAVPKPKKARKKASAVLRKERVAAKARITYHTKMLRRNELRLSGIQHALSRATDDDDILELTAERKKLRKRIASSSIALVNSKAAFKRTD